MASINVSLPEAMRTFVETKVATDGYGTVSEYVRYLIREAQKLEAEERLERALLQGLDSGNPTAADAKFWERKATQVAAKSGRAKKR